ncbi:nuclear transport factor 2 family protein [Nocardia vinacea]|uniref:nuclear transport factor 2 family protein n=1 Tax=Nocardia vinacea TaxID=96468 RepID=UPI003412ABCE
MTYTRLTVMTGTTALVPAHIAAADRVESAAAVAAVHAIKQLKARYLRAVDTKDWWLLEQQVMPDVVVDMTASAGIRTTGVDALIGYLQATIGPVRTIHQGHMPEIEVHTPATATGVWALQDLLIWPDTIRGSGFGHYYETYTLDGDRWRISSTTLTRLYLDPTAAQRLFRSSRRYRWSIGRWAASFRRRR